MALADVRLAHDGMTQHECSRVGCTRLTSEQECSEHAAEPAGVGGYGPLGAHWQRGCPCPQCAKPKEPRPEMVTLHRLIQDHEDASARFWREDGLGCAPLGGPVNPAAWTLADQRLAETKMRLVEMFDRLATARDEWKRRAEKAEAENARLTSYKDRLRGECVGALTEAGHYMLVSPEDPTGPGEVSRAIKRLAAERDSFSASYDNLDHRHTEMTERAAKAEAERDAALKRCDKLEAYVRLDDRPVDPRIEAWRALDAAERKVAVRMIRGFPYGARSVCLCNLAAAALEALAERP